MDPNEKQKAAARARLAIASLDVAAAAFGACCRCVFEALEDSGSECEQVRSSMRVIERSFVEVRSWLRKTAR